MDSLEYSHSKSLLRRQLLTARRAIAPEQRLNANHAIYERILNQPEWQTAKRIGCYISLPEEVSTKAIIKHAWGEGKETAAPVFDAAQRQIAFYWFKSFGELQPGPKRILQPALRHAALPGELDLLMIPGVGFDVAGNRIGFGEGCYDLFLKKSPAFRMALAFEAQILGYIPTDAQDQPMQAIITESRRLPA